MHYWKAARRGAESATPLLAPTILLICTGWILNLAGGAVGAPVIDQGAAAVIDQGMSNAIHENELHFTPRARTDDDEDDDDNGYATGANDDDPNNKIVSSTPAALTENMARNRDNDKSETKHVEGGGDGGAVALPVILLPTNILHALPKNETKYVEDVGSGENAMNASLHLVAVMEYEPNFVIRCAAKGSPLPNVTWEYEDGTFTDYVESTSLTHGHDGGGSGGGELERGNESSSSWVDLKLPKLNNAFYGKLRCRAVNTFGNASWEVELLHNANSSMFMKVVRCVLASVFLLVAVVLVKVIWWVDQKRMDKLYEKLPPQDLEAINKFKKGLVPPPPSPCSSIIVTERSSKRLLEGAANCVKNLEITVSGGGDGDESNSGNAVKEGYRPVKHVSSSPTLQQRLLTGGASTPSTCSSNQILDAVNSWTNYVPYDDKMETSSQHFTVDFTKIIENGSYGMVYVGKVRDDLTMEWSNVAVKSGRTQRNDDNYDLESILTELKILASLPKLHDNIVNIKGAYTKLLHKRQAYIFVDYCEHGTLANFIDLNRGKFQNTLMDLSTLNSPPSQDTISANSQNPGKEDNAILFSREGGDVSINSQKLQGVYEEQEHFFFKDLLTWAWQIAEGMHFLHKNRVIHGNLSSASVYLTSKLKIKIGNIGYPPLEEIMDCTDDNASKKWLTLPHYCYEQFSKRSDVWEYGRVIWEIFSLREQACPDNGRIVDFMQNGDVEEGAGEESEFDIPQYATPEIFELMLCCWNENATLCPEFDFFVKSFKKRYREALATAVAKNKRTAELQQDSKK